MQALRRRIFSLVALGVVGAAAPAVQAGAKGDQHTASGAKGANKTDLTDAQILGVADTANAGEVAQANIALTKAQKDSVKQFAQLMVKDHSAAKDKGRAIGKELGLIAAPSGLSSGIQKDGDEASAKLEKAQSTNFDRTYMQIQVRLHQKVLKTLDDLIPQADAAQVKDLLTDMRGHVEHHLSVARTTLGNLEK
jgi:putative membrane protein